MNQKNLLAPIIMRLAFFVINLFFTVQIINISGWNFFAILLTTFATRDFVNGVRLAQIYYYLHKDKNDKK